MDCIFCKIINGEMDSDIIFQNDRVMAFRDIAPKAPTHILIIPHKHIPTINDLEHDDTNLIGEMVQTAKQIASDMGIAESGYRLVFNVNKGAGQVVFHIHLHLLGGRSLDWPPG